MDWNRYHHKEFDDDFDLYLKSPFTFNPRPVRTIRVRSNAAASSNSEPAFETKLYSTSQDLQVWLDRWTSDKNAHQHWPAWSLDILILRRGSKNDSETLGESAGPQLWDLGCTASQFREIITEFDISKAFLKCLLRNRSFYSKAFDISEQGGNRLMTFLLRSSPSTLNDLALFSGTTVNTCNTVVLIQGCSERQEKMLTSWIEVMKDYAGHPMLIPALFFEAQNRSLYNRLQELRRDYVELDEALFDGSSFKAFTNNPELYQVNISRRSRLNERTNTVHSEFVALQPRLSDLVHGVDSCMEDFPQEQQSYMRRYGRLLKDNIQHLAHEVGYSETTAATLKESTSLLVSSMWSTITMNDSQISQQFSIASKRDSSVMKGITVGTLTFLPGTAIATIFAMPMFDWNAPPAHSVADSRFWIYLAVTIPITAFTLLTLFIWIWLSNIAATTNRGTGAVLVEQVVAWWHDLSRVSHTGSRTSRKSSPRSPA